MWLWFPVVFSCLNNNSQPACTGHDHYRNLSNHCESMASLYTYRHAYMHTKHFRFWWSRRFLMGLGGTPKKRTFFWEHINVQQTKKQNSFALWYWLILILTGCSYINEKQIPPYVKTLSQKKMSKIDWCISW